MGWGGVGWGGAGWGGNFFFFSLSHAPARIFFSHFFSLSLFSPSLPLNLENLKKKLRQELPHLYKQVPRLAKKKRAELCAKWPQTAPDKFQVRLLFFLRPCFRKGERRGRRRRRERNLSILPLSFFSKKISKKKTGAVPRGREQRGGGIREGGRALRDGGYSEIPRRGVRAQDGLNSGGRRVFKCFFFFFRVQDIFFFIFLLQLSGTIDDRSKFRVVSFRLSVCFRAFSFGLSN